MTYTINGEYVHCLDNGKIYPNVEAMRQDTKNDEVLNLKQQLSQLQQEKEELIKRCENEIYNQKESIELLSNKKYADIHIGAINAYKNVLSKLKESDKDVS